MYDILLFDLDGTLTDPGEGITNSVAYALKKRGIEVKDRKELYPFIGPPLLDSFMRYFGFSEEEAEECVKDYRVYFSDRGIFENEVYPGVPKLLEALKEQGKTVVLATSKPEHFAKQILDHFDLAKYFDLAAGATMDKSRSKKGDVIAYALRSLGDPEKSCCLMIGDREQDITGAKQNGIASLGVLYGYGDRAEHEAAGADYIAETVEEILNFI